MLGGAGLLWMCGDLILKYRNPSFREKWFWWGNFLLGIAGALSFAVPAILVAPAMILFPAWFANNSAFEKILLGGIFFATGLLTFAALFFIGREMYKERP